MTTKTMTGAVIDGPKIKTALPGPNAKRVLAGDDQLHFAVLHPLLSDGGQAGARHCRYRCGRQRVFRFLIRHCRDFDRPLPS